jgi:hypothetical protein
MTTLSPRSSRRIGRFYKQRTPQSFFNQRGRFDGDARGFDRPPLKWSTQSYGFALKEDRDAEEELQAGRDRRQAAAG